MRKVLLSLAIFIIAAIMVLTACTSSTDSTVDSDELAESLQAQTDLLIYNMGDFFDDGVDYIDDGAGYARPADTSYYTFDQQTYWWTYTLEYTLTSESLNWTIDELDSVRFSADDSYQIIPDSTTDGLELHIIGEDVMTFSVDSVMGVQYDIDFEFANANTDTVDVNGTFDYLIEITMGDLEYDYDFGCTFEDIKITEQQSSYYAYPIDGTMTVDVTITSTGDADSGIPAGTWTASIQVEFNATGYNGSMTVEGENYTWETTWSDLSGVMPVSRP